MGKFYTYDEIKEEFENRNYTLITDHKIKSKDKYEYICNKHADKGHQFITWGHFHNNHRGCRYCGLERIGETHSKDLSQYDGKFLAESKGFEYIGMLKHDKKIWVQFICPKHRQYGVQEMPYNNMKRVAVGCQYCIGRNENKDDILQQLYEINPYAMVLDDFSCKKDNVRILCVKHNIIHNQTIRDALTGRGCCKCRIEKLSNGAFLSEEEFKNRLCEKYPNIKLIGKYNGAKERTMFKCLDCNSNIYDFASYIERRGCPNCNDNTNETKVGAILQKYNYSYIRQKSFDDCKDIKALPFDYYLPDYNLLIEYDGEGHYFPINFGGMNDEKAKQELLYIQSHDKIKTEYCLINNIPLIRIPYTEKNNMENFLLQELLKIGVTQQND